MIYILLFLILAVLCWPLALIALVLCPLIWLLLLPFRILGLAVGAVSDDRCAAPSGPPASSAASEAEPRRASGSARNGT